MRSHHSFIFLLLRYIPLAIRLLISRYWRRLFSETPQGKQRQFAELVGFTLRQLDVEVTDNRLHEISEIIPNHLSTDATETIPFLLDQWNIQATIGIAEDENSSEVKSLDSLNLPCLIRLDNGEPATILAHSKTHGYVLVYCLGSGIKIMGQKGLDTIWSGFFFTIGTNQSLQQPFYSEQASREHWEKWRYPSIALCLGSLIAVSFINQLLNNSGMSLILWLSIGLCLLGGLSLSLILAQHSMGNSGGLLASLCTNNSQHTCTDILDNSNAKFFGIPHADIGIVYFGGSLALLSTELTIPWLTAIFSVFALAYSVYSFIFQRYIIGQWCRLCIAVQIIIAIQALIIYLASERLSFLPTEEASTISSLIIFLIPGLVWAMLRHSIMIERVKHELEQQFKAIVLSTDKIQAIKSAITSRSHFFVDSETNNIENDEPLEGDIILGLDNDQDMKVTIGLSPSCHHCGIFLEEIVQFINSKHWPITVRIRLIVSEGYEQEAINDRTLSESIMALVVSEGSDIALETLRLWYQRFKAEDIKGWQASIRTITNDEINDVGILLADTSYWASQHTIDAMPALFIENNYLPYVSAEYSTILLRKLSIE